MILFSLIAGIAYLLFTHEPPHRRRQREREERRWERHHKRVNEEHTYRRQRERKESHRAFAEDNRRREQEAAQERIRCSTCGTDHPPICCSCDSCLVCYPPGPYSYQEDQCDNCGWNIYMD